MNVGMQVSKQIEPDEPALSTINKAIYELSLVVMGAELAQPLPPGWTYERITSSEFDPTGNAYVMTVTSTPRRITPVMAEDPIGQIPSQAPPRWWL